MYVVWYSFFWHIRHVSRRDLPRIIDLTWSSDFSSFQPPRVSSQIINPSKRLAGSFSKVSNLFSVHSINVGVWRNTNLRQNVGRRSKAITSSWTNKGHLLGTGFLGAAANAGLYILPFSHQFKRFAEKPLRSFKLPSGSTAAREKENIFWK